MYARIITRRQRRRRFVIIVYKRCILYIMCVPIGRETDAKNERVNERRVRPRQIALNDPFYILLYCPRIFRKRCETRYMCSIYREIIVYKVFFFFLFVGIWIRTRWTIYLNTTRDHDTSVYQYNII